MPQLPSLVRWALLPFWGFPTLTCFLFFGTTYFLGTCIIFFSQQVLGLYLGLFILSLFFCTIFWVSLKGLVYKSSTSTYDLQTILVQDFVPIRTALRGEGIASFSSILFTLLVVLVLFLYSIFCLCPSFRVWSDGLYFLFGVFLP